MITVSANNLFSARVEQLNLVTRQLSGNVRLLSYVSVLKQNDTFCLKCYYKNAPDRIEIGCRYVKYVLPAIQLQRRA